MLFLKMADVLDENEWSAISSANNIQDYLRHHNPKSLKTEHTRQNIKR